MCCCNVKYLMAMVKICTCIPSVNVKYLTAVVKISTLASGAHVHVCVAANVKYLMAMHGEK